jgi:hypothetical protein
MNDNLIPDSQPVKTTPDEEKLLQQLRNNPILAMQLTSISDRFEHEISNGRMDAHEAEAAMIDALQHLGKGMMQQWAQNTQSALIKQTSELQKHSKKNFSGIPPSD